MATRLPMVILSSGEIGEMPSGDTLPSSVVPGGGGGGGSITWTDSTGNVCTSGQTLTISHTSDSSNHRIVKVKLSVPEGGPAIWLKFDEGSGSTANDSSGNGNGGTITISSFSTGHVGAYCITQSSSSGNYTQVSNSAALQFTSAFSCSFWMNQSTTLGNNGMCFKGSDYQIHMESGNIVFDINGNNSTRWRTTGTPIASNSTWYHVVITYAAGIGPLFYVNGSLVASTQSAGSTSPTINVSTNALIVGAYYSTGYCFVGSLDDFRLYGRVLSSAEITSLASGTSYPILASIKSQLTNGSLGIDAGSTSKALIEETASASTKITVPLSGTYDISIGVG